MAIDQAEMLEVLLASCATWQGLAAGAGDVAAARARIHHYEAAADATYPLAVVQEEDAWSREAGVGQYSGGGVLSLTFYFVPNRDDYPTRETRRAYIRNLLFTIKSEMEVLSASRATPTGYSVSHLVVRRITVSCFPFERSPSKETGGPNIKHTWVAQLDVEY